MIYLPWQPSTSKELFFHGRDIFTFVHSLWLLSHRVNCGHSVRFQTFQGLESMSYCHCRSLHFRMNLGWNGSHKWQQMNRLEDRRNFVFTKQSQTPSNIRTFREFVTGKYTDFEQPATTQRFPHLVLSFAFSILTHRQIKTGANIAKYSIQ